MRLPLTYSFFFLFALESCLQPVSPPAKPQPLHDVYFINTNGDTVYTIQKSDEEWKSQLDPMAYYVLREKGTERAFSGIYHDFKKQGNYVCRGCALPLFSSDTKFNSGTGWPSFYAPLDGTHVLEVTDDTYGMRRTEVVCHRCGGHLGHVFPDGPKPTGLRYCMNSVSLAFLEQNQE